MSRETDFQVLKLEYEQINQNFRLLADVRFKLLALVPTLGGAAVFVLSHAGLQNGEAEKVAPLPVLVAVLVVSVFGFLATLGITLYDQRNSELYNALIHRAKYLEERFQVPGTPAGIEQVGRGGQFRERPKKHRRLIFEAGHDFGLALIYGPLLGAWLFPISYVTLRLVAPTLSAIQAYPAVIAGLAAIGFSWYLVYLDDQDRRLYLRAALRDAPPESQVQQTA